MNVQEALARLTGVKQAGPNKWTAFCPCCEPDKTKGNRHLGVSEGNNGKLLLNCLHGCRFEDIVKTIESLGRNGLAPSHRKRANKKSGGKKMGKTYTSIEAAVEWLQKDLNGVMAGRWDYTDAFSVLRFNLADGGKTFRPVHRNGAGWVVADPPEPLPLYRVDALPADGLVWVVEGEKCADALAALGMPAVTSSHGSESPGKSYWAPLAGRDVVIWPDGNEAGRRYGQAVAAIITGLVPPARVRIMEPPPGLPEGGDVVDWIEPLDAKEPEELRQAVLDLADEAPEWAPGTKDGSDEGEALLVVQSMDSVEPEPIRWLWKHKLARGKLTLLAGDGGTCKSFISLDLAARLSRGASWPDGMPNELTAGTLLLTCEDDANDTIRPRLDAAGADVRRVHHVKGIEKPGEGMLDLVALEKDLPLVDHQLRTASDCALLVIDPIGSYLASTDENSNVQLRRVLAGLSELAGRTGVAVLLIHHLRKSGGTAVHRTLGSVAFVTGVRMAFVALRDPDDETQEQCFFLPTKSNLSRCRSGLAYSIAEDDHSRPYVRWEREPIYVDADDVVTTPSKRERGPSPKTLEAMNWLKAALTDGPRPARELIAEAKKDGIGKRSLDSAKAHLGVQAQKAGFAGGWQWGMAL